MVHVGEGATVGLLLETQSLVAGLHRKELG